MKSILCVDIGTTSTKTLIVERSGRVAASHEVGYPLHTPFPDRAEQDPIELYNAVRIGIKEVISKAGLQSDDILCVSFSSAMHSLIAVDKELNPLTQCITWADNRSVEYAERLKADGSGRRIYLNTGTPIHPMSPLLKLMWLRDNEPELFQSTYKFIGIKEFVFAKLFGQYVIDYSIASATGLFNLKALQWDEEALAASGVRKNQLSEPVPTTYKAVGLQPADAEWLGLAVDTPFVAGASDGVLANLGTGACSPGIYAVTIGTSGAVRGVVTEPVTDPKGRLFCYALDEDMWVIGGAINNGGIMMRWARDQIASKEAEEAKALGIDPYERMFQIAEDVAPGADGLIFMPFLAGERAPYWNANARGMFFGLSLYHERKHMIRAVAEGVAYRIHSVAEALKEISGPAKEIRASGGFARSGLWTQIMADVLETQVVITESIQSSSIGAAMLALKAMGEISSYSEVQDWLETSKTYEPVEERFPIYRELTDIYNRVYGRLLSEFDSIADYQKRRV